MGEGEREREREEPKVERRRRFPPTTPSEQSSMSIDLDWSALDAHLTLSTTNFLKAAFSSAPRPNFVGPLELTAFSFGDHQPDLELVDIGDIYREFLTCQQDDDDDDLAPPPPPPPPHQHHTPPLHQEQDHFPRPLPFSPTPTPSVSHPHPHGASLFSPGLHHSSFPSPSLSRSRSHSPAPPFPPHHSHHPHPPAPLSSASHTHAFFPNDDFGPPSPSAASLSSLPPPTSSAPAPSLQAHLRLAYSGNLSLGISTSLLINYPSLGFMSLPLSLTLTGLAFDGTLVVAYEGGRRRVHLSILDPGPTEGGGGGGGGKETPGMRVLRSVVVESEVGQADKHVLKNVGKVEKFVLEVARKTIESELIFPCVLTFSFSRMALSFSSL